MEELRLILAMVFLTEIIIALMHLGVFILGDEEFPLEFYWLAPIFMIVLIFFAMAMIPILNWIAGC